MRLSKSCSSRFATETASCSPPARSSSRANSSPPRRAPCRPREAGAQPVRHRPQQLVAGVVAVAVVDGLELVDVEQQHADPRAAGLERVLEAVVEQRAVRQLGERVVERLALELVLERLELAHGLLEAVVLERDRHVAGERLEQAQVLVGEAAVHALAPRDGEQPDAAGLAVERRDNARSMPRPEVLALGGVVDALDLDRPGEPGREAAQALRQRLVDRLEHPPAAVARERRARRAVRLRRAGRGPRRRPGRPRPSARAAPRARARSRTSATACAWPRRGTRAPALRRRSER